MVLAGIDVIRLPKTENAQDILDVEEEIKKKLKKKMIYLLEQLKWWRLLNQRVAF